MLIYKKEDKRNDSDKIERIEDICDKSDRN